jgi:hypothetical protein
VLAEKTVRADGLMLNDGQTKSLELFPSKYLSKSASTSDWLSLCHFYASISFELNKSFSQK